MEVDEPTEGEGFLSDGEKGGEEDLNDQLDSMSTDDKKHKKKKSKKHKKKDKDRKKEKSEDAPGFLPVLVQPAAEPEVWERIDDGKSVYYYNAAKGASAWLAPCSVCHATASKWCIECGLSYCEHDFEAVHDGEDSTPEMLTHTSSYTEIAAKDVLQPGEVYCLKCNVKTASRVCVQCDDDPYCAECFRLVHYCGYLKCHRAVAYQRAKAGWHILRFYDGQPDQYKNGATGEVTNVKPIELQSELEQVHHKNMDMHKRAMEKSASELEQLLKELGDTTAQRNQLELEQIRRKAEIAAKEAEEAKKNKR